VRRIRGKLIVSRSMVIPQAGNNVWVYVFQRLIAGAGPPPPSKISGRYIGCPVVSVAVGVGVLEGVRVFVAVGVVPVGVREGVKVRDAVRVLVGLGVEVRVALGVKVREGV